MRIRHKPWARPELEESDFYIKEPTEQKGKWNEIFVNKEAPLYLELGCGKGGFIAQAAPAKRDINFVAVDIKNEMLVLAKRKIEEAYNEKNIQIDNVKVMIRNIETIDECFSCDDNIQRIYINFCNPWPKEKHKKRRLTHTRQLVKYKEIMKSSAEIWFKTDDDELFNESFEYFDEAGFEIKYKTFDLNASGFEENFVTEHEKMFSDEGKKIKFLIAGI